MSGSERRRWSIGSRWRAPMIGAVTGLAVAAAIVVPSAIASAGRSAGPCAAGNNAAAAKLAAATAHQGAPAAQAAAKAGVKAPGGSAGGVPPQFLAAVAQLQQAGTISAAQARTLDADIESGSIDPKQLVADGVLTAAQMQAVNDRLVAVKMGLATQAHAGSSASRSKTGG